MTNTRTEDLYRLVELRPGKLGRIRATGLTLEEAIALCRSLGGGFGVEMQDDESEAEEPFTLKPTRGS